MLRTMAARFETLFGSMLPIMAVLAAGLALMFAVVELSPMGAALFT
jgi:hypothetical protein